MPAMRERSPFPYRSRHRLPCNGRWQRTDRRSSLGQGQLLPLPRRGISQTDVATIVDLPASNISHFESGRRLPSLPNLVTLADALGATTDELLGRSQL